MMCCSIPEGFRLADHLVCLLCVVLLGGAAGHAVAADLSGACYVDSRGFTTASVATSIDQLPLTSTVQIRGSSIAIGMRYEFAR